jgi:MoaA/NifB/PqqE/SkfB family radical SAM enzyme
MSSLAKEHTAKVHTVPAVEPRPALTAPMISGIRKLIIERIIWAHLGWIAFARIKNPIKAIKALRRMEALRKMFMGKHNVRKLAKANGKYYWDMHTPGWPSKAFVKYHEGEFNRIQPFRKKTGELKTMILAITKKCPLRCEHCYEWDTLNQKDHLSVEELQQVLHKFQDWGVAQVQLSGGEPLNRFNDLIALLKSAKPGTDFWLLTSGYGLTLEKAKALKAAGLGGVAISLDHVDASKHNTFRGSGKSFDWVKNAAYNAHEAGLLTALSICVSRDFVNENNLMQYAQLAADYGVGFIQLFEPRATGHYAGKSIGLTKAHEGILDEFYLKMNYDKQYLHLPAVIYHGYHQRKIGCFGGGNRYLYVDADGDVHPCPFCKKKAGNVLTSSVQGCMDQMKSKACLAFNDSLL